MNNIRRNVETAVWMYLGNTNDPGTGVNVYRWADAPAATDRVAYPCIVVWAKAGRPFSDTIDATSGATNRYVSVEITCSSPCADGEEATARDQHDTLCGRIMDSLYSSTLVADLNANAPAGVAIEQVDLPTDEDAIADGMLETRITFDLLAHGKAT
jgi:hypothetical protein